MTRRMVVVVMVVYLSESEIQSGRSTGVSTLKMRPSVSTHHRSIGLRPVGKPSLHRGTGPARGPPSRGCSRTSGLPGWRALFLTEGARGFSLCTGHAPADEKSPGRAELPIVSTTPTHPRAHPGLNG
jgi:hypothetical protein